MGVFDKIKGIGALPVHKSNIFFVVGLIVTKLGKRTDSSENLNQSSF